MLVGVGKTLAEPAQGYTLVVYAAGHEYYTADIAAVNKIAEAGDPLLAVVVPFHLIAFCTGYNALDLFGSQDAADTCAKLLVVRRDIQG